MLSSNTPIALEATFFGTLPAWLGAFGTVLSLSTGVWYYHANLKREEIAQARHVRLTTMHHEAETGNIVAKIHNFSDESIFDVWESQGRKPSFREVLVDALRATKGRKPSDEEIAALKARWDNTSGGRVGYDGYDTAHIEAGGSKEITFEGPSDTQNFWIEFRDSRANQWTLALDQNEPCRVCDPDSKDRWWRVVGHPVAAGREWKTNRELKKWLNSVAQQ
ncbi:hypothetical protein AB0M13_25980 [Nocardia fluminea]|uniref:hypothetical protein n=1 Tax=Nocardia fluminea TaxID=134984 RepID=UPI003423E47D